MGCLKAFAKTTWTKKFYDLERLKFNGMNAQWDMGFDETKVLNAAQIAQLKVEHPDLEADVDYKGRKPVRALPVKVMACGGGDQQFADAAARLVEHMSTDAGGQSDGDRCRPGDVARIGPNAILRLIEALDERFGRPRTEAVFRAAGQYEHLSALPDAMVDERSITALYTSLPTQLGLADAAEVSAHAGLLTGEYLLEHRIPGRPSA